MTAMQELARRAGLLDHYHTIDGTLHTCSDATRAALLGAMGLAAEAEDQAAATLARLDREAALPEHPDEIVVPVRIAVETGFREFRIVLEDGSERAGDAAHPGRLPPLPSGVHRLLADGRETLVIAAPDAAPLVAERAGEGLVWGVTAALYGLQSSRNQGLGDFGDLAAAGAALGKAGSAFLGINPVHARGIADQGTSPYSPSSRTGFDTGHIAIDLIPEFAGCAEAQALLGHAVPEPSDGLIDYAAIRARTRPALRAVHAAFSAGSGARQAAFAKWREARDPALLLQSIYEALSEHHGPDWRAWPQALRVPESPEVRRFAADNAAAIDFHEWCQWIAEQQLAAAQQAAKAGGMALGLYLDIAVGVRPGGAETWANRTAFAVGASLGAPPDLLNGNGQSWDLAPFSPVGLRALGYAPFRQMLRSAMAHAGMVRIDHVIGLARSFWVPANGAPGGYVRFPTETLLALIRIEAQRAGCVVIGEDLGTVPDGLREALAGSGVYGCSILPFERNGADFLDPWHYRTRTLASFGTHDLPPMAGWWRAGDVETRLRLRHIDPAIAAAQRAERAEERRRLCRMLLWTDLLPDGIDPDQPPEALSPALRDAIHLLVARSGLLSVSLDDMFGVELAQNVPGTVIEEPNWRRRAPLPVEEIEGAGEISRLAAALSQALHRPGDEGEGSQARRRAHRIITPHGPCSPRPPTQLTILFASAT